MKEALAPKKMSYCRLCVNICENFTSFYDAHGYPTTLYRIVVKYFHPTILNIENHKELSGICHQCRAHIWDFMKFQKFVIEAQIKLVDVNENEVDNLPVKDKVNSTDVSEKNIHPEERLEMSEDTDIPAAPDKLELTHKLNVARDPGKVIDVTDKGSGVWLDHNHAIEVADEVTTSKASEELDDLKTFKEQDKVDDILLDELSSGLKYDAADTSTCFKQVDAVLYLPSRKENVSEEFIDLPTMQEVRNDVNIIEEEEEEFTEFEYSADTTTALCTKQRNEVRSLTLGNEKSHVVNNNVERLAQDELLTKNIEASEATIDVEMIEDNEISDSDNLNSVCNPSLPPASKEINAIDNMELPKSNSSNEELHKEDSQENCLILNSAGREEFIHVQSIQETNDKLVQRISSQAVCSIANNVILNEDDNDDTNSFASENELSELSTNDTFLASEEEQESLASITPELVDTIELSDDSDVEYVDSQFENVPAKFLKNLKCSKCQLPFKDWKYLYRHIRQEHPKLNMYVICCRQKFKNLQGLKEHFKTHKKFTVKVNQTFNKSSYTCLVCQTDFDNKKDLHSHYIQIHGVQHSFLNESDLLNLVSKDGESNQGVQSKRKPSQQMVCRNIKRSRRAILANHQVKLLSKARVQKIEVNIAQQRISKSSTTFRRSSVDLNAVSSMQHIIELDSSSQESFTSSIDSVEKLVPNQENTIERAIPREKHVIDITTSSKTNYSGCKILCVYCKQRFSSNSFLSKHYSDAHGFTMAFISKRNMVNGIRTSQNFFKCKLCPKTFASYVEFLGHRKSHRNQF